MEEQIKTIQNQIWKAYKNCLSTKDWTKFDKDICMIMKEYDSNKLLCDFIVMQAMAFEPVLKEMIDWGNNNERERVS